MPSQATIIKVTDTKWVRVTVLAQLLLTILTYCNATLAAEEQVSITVISKKNETGETTSWAEPTLFPAEVEGSSNLSPAVRKAKRVSVLNPDTPFPPESEENGIPGMHSETEFQTSSRNPETESNALGFLASRERDAILARIQRDTSSEPYNIKIWHIPFRLTASLDLDFTDNFERTGDNSESELIVLPRIDISGSVKLASRITLSLQAGIGYIKYLNHGENDRILTVASLSPNADTGISLDFKAGKFLISVYDRPFVPQFQVDVATQRNQSQYSQFTNTAGLNIIWNINSKTDLSLRYNHTNLISLGSEENTTDGVVDSFLASLSRKLSESLGVGIQGGGDITGYENNLLNSGTSYHVGAFSTYELSRHLRLRGGFGYQGGAYDSGGGVEDSSSLGTYYANISVANNLNSRISHSLSLGREAQRGAYSNFTLSHYIRYQVGWDVLNNVNLNAWTSFEDIEESGGLFAQHFRYYSAGASCSLSVSPRISFTLTYVFTKRSTLGESSESSLQESFLDFTENRVNLRLNYAF